jgi:hypothetical protein
MKLAEGAGETGDLELVQAAQRVAPPCLGTIIARVWRDVEPSSACRMSGSWRPISSGVSALPAPVLDLHELRAWSALLLRRMLGGRAKRK